MPRSTAIPDLLWRTILRRLAETGEPRAQYEYFLALPRTEPGSAERAEQQRWLERAARTLPEAQASAASRLRGDRALLSEADERRARRWEQRAAEAGAPSSRRIRAWWWLRGHVPRPWDGPGARHLRSAVRAGDGYAAHDLALEVETFAGDLTR